MMTTSYRDGFKRGAESLWHTCYAYWPVLPIDERGPFWLEPLWCRRNPETGRWQYRSFRSEQVKLREMCDRIF